MHQLGPLVGAPSVWPFLSLLHRRRRGSEGDAAAAALCVTTDEKEGRGRDAQEDSQSGGHSSNLIVRFSFSFFSACPTNQKSEKKERARGWW
jgi:hypothetical protein